MTGTKYWSKEEEEKKKRKKIVNYVWISYHLNSCRVLNGFSGSLDHLSNELMTLFIAQLSACSRARYPCLVYGHRAYTYFGRGKDVQLDQADALKVFLLYPGPEKGKFWCGSAVLIIERRWQVHVPLPHAAAFWSAPWLGVKRKAKRKVTTVLLRSYINGRVYVA